MSGSKLLLDTNIILYYLSGDDTLTPLLEEKNLFISIITEIELLSYSEFKEEELSNIKAFLGYCISKDISDDVKREAINLRRSYKLKLPAIIMATAISMNIPLITADKMFKKVKTGHLIFYEK
jgi:predicted nucleic acid-binding protein